MRRTSVAWCLIAMLMICEARPAVEAAMARKSASSPSALSFLETQVTTRLSLHEDSSQSENSGGMSDDDGKFIEGLLSTMFIYFILSTIFTFVSVHHFLGGQSVFRHLSKKTRATINFAMRLKDFDDTLNGKPYSDSDRPYLFLVLASTKYTRYHVYAKIGKCPTFSQKVSRNSLYCDILQNSRPLIDPTTQPHIAEYVNILSDTVDRFGGPHNFAGFVAYGNEDYNLQSVTAVQNVFARNALEVPMITNLGVKAFPAHKPRVIMGTRQAFYLYKGYLAANRDKGNFLHMTDSSFMIAVEIRSEYMLKSFKKMLRNLRGVVPPCNEQVSDEHFATLSLISKFVPLPPEGEAADEQCLVDDGSPPKCVGLMNFFTGEMIKNQEDGTIEQLGCPLQNVRNGWNVLGGARIMMPIFTRMVIEDKTEYRACVEADHTLPSCEQCLDKMVAFIETDKQVKFLSEFFQDIKTKDSQRVMFYVGGDVELAMVGYGLTNKDGTKGLRQAVNKYPNLGMFPCSDTENENTYNIPVIGKEENSTDTAKSNDFNDIFFTMWSQAILKVLDIDVRSLRTSSFRPYWPDFAAQDLGYPAECTMHELIGTDFTKPWLPKNMLDSVANEDFLHDMLDAAPSHGDPRTVCTRDVVEEMKEEKVNNAADKAKSLGVQYA